jgi:putative endonuclease
LIAAEPTRAQASGARAEDRAARFLEDRGLAIVERNFRTRLGEIDLIAREGPVLVFVEVRLRADPRFGRAEETVGWAKQRRICAAARYYLMRLRDPPPCRFDVVALEDAEPRWLRGAFEAAW